MWRIFKYESMENSKQEIMKQEGRKGGRNRHLTSNINQFGTFSLKCCAASEYSKWFAIHYIPIFHFHWTNIYVYIFVTTLLFLYIVMILFLKIEKSSHHHHLLLWVLIYEMSNKRNTLCKPNMFKAPKLNHR